MKEEQEEVDDQGYSKLTRRRSLTRRRRFRREEGKVGFGGG